MLVDISFYQTHDDKEVCEKLWGMHFPTDKAAVEYAARHANQSDYQKFVILEVKGLYECSG